ncbi:autotransporter outer membrane beta-barrel domain-containing protein [Caulobacter hibisci]|uniref:Autotransporter domain-containing protein n=1 Tax=Caulobacter hibisci TaxID=2035993 RepID=A0ABS0SU43_9CAUL|nr:autotransporter outer membrane beta-barrel domain-containing protein [Caulobacter hibisci]MBI1682771.1 hypothetical protein [Caulobacter hibisci]
MAGTAQAACSPNPPTGLVTTFCSGATTGRLTVATTSTTEISAGASLTAAGGDNAAVLITSTGTTYMTPVTTATLNVLGRINGGAGAGVLVRNETTVPYFNQTTANIVVGADGVIEGATAIRLDGTTGANYYGRSMASIDNSGVIRSSSGAALVASPVDRTAFLTVINRAGGYIGGISGTVQTLDNAGVIDGGSGSAFSYASGNYALWGGVVTNTGTIRSSGSVATINPGSAPSIINSGLIVNTGTGVAIGASGGIVVDNKTGGVIQGGGSVAIDAFNGSGALRITNRGVINGSVLATSYAYDGSSVDNVGGVINGDLVFGSSGDVLIAAWGASGLDYGTITGRLDGGGGANAVRLLVSSDQTLGQAFAGSVLPTNFQTYQIALSNSAVVTFEGDLPDGVALSGTGGVVSKGTVNTTGTAFSTYYTSGMRLNFTNSGDITAQLSIPSGSGPYLPSAYAVYLRGAAKFVNSGTIQGLNGNGAYVVQDYSTDTFLNSGSIIGSAYGLTVSGLFTNEGLIRSTDGVAVLLDLGGGVTRGKTSTNTGRIEGVTSGVTMSSVTLVNNGVITASNGAGVAPGYYSTVDNGADGVIAGTTGSIAAGYNVIVRNAGTLNGDVNLAASYYDTSSDVFWDAGGTLNGSLLLGGGDDYFVTDLGRIKNGKFVGVTGLVDAGAGADTLVLRIATDTKATLGAIAGFEKLALTLADDAKATIAIDGVLNSSLATSGAGTLDLTADIATSDSILTVNGPLELSTQGVSYGATSQLSVISRGALSVNQSVAGYWTRAIQLTSGATFENAGSLTVSGAIAITGGDKVVNSGTIALSNAAGLYDAKTFVNTGSLTQTAGSASGYVVSGVLTVQNSGTISTISSAIQYGGWSSTPFTVTNSGVIASSSGAAIQSEYASNLVNITNAAGGSISGATAAISTGYYADTIRNDGAITGLISTGYGDDRIENYGTITGRVDLGDGNDTFVQWLGGKMDGTVDGGYGLDTLVIDSTGGGSLSGSQFVNFESFRQIGGGSITYSGDFTASTLLLDGGEAKVAAGTTVRTTGSTTFSGGASGERLINEGTIAGRVSFAGGVDSIVNRGVIGGTVSLGAGDDSFTEGAGSSAGNIDGGGGIDTYIVELAGDRTGLSARTNFEALSVTGQGTLGLTLDQNWTSISLAGAGLTLRKAGFSVAGVYGGDAAETVSIDGDVATINLGGGDDRLILAGASFGGLKIGGAGVDVLSFTDTGLVTLTGQFSGFETVNLAGGALAVAGSFGATGDTTAFGAGSQTLSVLSGGVLSGTIDLGAGDDVLRLAAGGQLAGTVLGGAGSDLVSIDLVSDLSLRGDQLQQFETLEVTGTGALNFTGGAAQFTRLVTSSQDFTIASGASLQAGDLTLGVAANTVTVGGAFQGRMDLGAGDDLLRLTSGSTFSGSAAGGAGYDRLELAVGGTDAAPTAFGVGAFTGFEALGVQSGVSSLSGDFGFDTIQVSGGRLIGLAGSRLSASTITVGQGATFGSAGAVVGDIAVSGTLSPGASPGTMTVTGNVALAAGSTSLFELTSSVSDKLVVSGKVTIAQGATLKLTGAATGLTPGRRLDLIVANGGITGSFSTVQGAEDLNLHLTQSATRLEALGLFTTSSTFSREVSNLVTTLNTALIADKASASLVAALPALVDPTTGRSNAAALARVTPQAYASATQLATEDGLAVIDAARGQSRFAPEEAGLFGFGQAFAGRRDLDGDTGAGVVSGKIDGAGLISGVGYGLKSAWIGGFVGYLDGRQRLAGLDARTELDGFVVGALGRVALSGFELDLAAAHDSADTATRRTAPGGVQASGDYKLKTWVADARLSYPVAVGGGDWAVRPSLGASYVATKRGGVAEQGGGAFGLTLSGESTTTWFVDGQVELRGGQAAGAKLHPFVSLGFRSRVGGDDPAASARLTGLDATITADGLQRAKTLGAVGAGLGYDVSGRMTVSTAYSGEFGDGGRQAVLAGLNWKF